MKNIFKFITPLLFMGIVGLVFASCGDDDEIVVEKVEYTTTGDLKMTVVYQDVHSDCGTLSNHKMDVKINQEHTYASIELDEFTTPPLVDYRNMVISMSDLNIKGLKLTEKQKGVYEVKQNFEAEDVDISFAVGAPAKKYKPTGEISGTISSDKKVNLHILVSFEGMPIPLILDYTN